MNRSTDTNKVRGGKKKMHLPFSRRPLLSLVNVFYERREEKRGRERIRV